MSDEGPGMSLTEQTQIFKRFYKGAHAREDSVGIGLAMAHSIITNQQGSIEVDSTLGEGTTFTITFYHEKHLT
ncbi:MAG TPA: sensor histidine kinase, partial [Virgibacillus sp.]|nr:sensor histidine kinase [Virgibacillus sp.]